MESLIIPALSVQLYQDYSVLFIGILAATVVWLAMYLIIILQNIHEGFLTRILRIEGYGWGQKLKQLIQISLNQRYEALHTLYTIMGILVGFIGIYNFGFKTGVMVVYFIQVSQLYLQFYGNVGLSGNKLPDIKWIYKSWVWRDAIGTWLTVLLTQVIQLYQTQYQFWALGINVGEIVVAIFLVWIIQYISFMLIAMLKYLFKQSINEISPKQTVITKRYVSVLALLLSDVILFAVILAVVIAMIANQPKFYPQIYRDDFKSTPQQLQAFKVGEPLSEELYKNQIQLFQQINAPNISLNQLMDSFLEAQRFQYSVNISRVNNTFLLNKFRYREPLYVGNMQQQEYWMVLESLYDEYNQNLLGSRLLNLVSGVRVGQVSIPTSYDTNHLQLVLSGVRNVTRQSQNCKVSYPNDNNDCGSDVSLSFALNPAAQQGGIFSSDQQIISSNDWIREVFTNTQVLQMIWDSKDTTQGESSADMTGGELGNKANQYWYSQVFTVALQPQLLINSINCPCGTVDGFGHNGCQNLENRTFVSLPEYGNQFQQSAVSIVYIVQVRKYTNEPEYYTSPGIYYTLKTQDLVGYIEGQQLSVNYKDNTILGNKTLCGMQDTSQIMSHIYQFQVNMTEWANSTNDDSNQWYQDCLETFNYGGPICFFRYPTRLLLQPILKPIISIGSAMWNEARGNADTTEFQPIENDWPIITGQTNGQFQYGTCAKGIQGLNNSDGTKQFLDIRDCSEISKATKTTQDYQDLYYRQYYSDYGNQIGLINGRIQVIWVGALLCVALPVQVYQQYRSLWKQQQLIDKDKNSINWRENEVTHNQELDIDQLEGNPNLQQDKMHFQMSNLKL